TVDHRTQFTGIRVTSDCSAPGFSATGALATSRRSTMRVCRSSSPPGSARTAGREDQEGGERERDAHEPAHVLPLLPRGQALRVEPSAVDRAGAVWVTSAS